MQKIGGQIADANGEIRQWIELGDQFHHQTNASGGSLSKAYKILLELMIYVPGIQQFSLASRLHSQIRNHIDLVQEERRAATEAILQHHSVVGEITKGLIDDLQKHYDAEITYRNNIEKYNAAKKDINKPVAPADFSHISLKGPHRTYEGWSRGKGQARGENYDDKNLRGQSLLSLSEILTGRTILLSILEALQLLSVTIPDGRALLTDFLNAIVNVLHAFWVAATKRHANEIGSRRLPAKISWIKGTGSPPSGGLIDFISKELPEDRTQGSLHEGLKEIEDC